MNLFGFVDFPSKFLQISINSTSGDSDDDSNQTPTSASGSASDTTQQKPRNIAVKKGAPASRPQTVPLQRPPQQPPRPQQVPSIAQPSQRQPQYQQQISIPDHMKSKTARELLEGSKFLADFNPENSRREKNKRFNLVKPPKQAKNRSTQSMYDEQGRLRANKADVCDCFDTDCPGCHFECQVCGSQKCGVRCRNNRRWAFEVIEHDGKDLVKVNHLLTSINFH
jgi:hypothetical protein